MLSVTVVIEVPNESDANLFMVLLLDHTTTEASSFLWCIPPLPPYSLLVRTRTALVNEIMSNLVLVFPLILILVQNILMNVSKNTEHNFAGLEALLWYYPDGLMVVFQAWVHWFKSWIRKAIPFFYLGCGFPSWQKKKNSSLELKKEKVRIKMTPDYHINFLKWSPMKFGSADQHTAHCHVGIVVEDKASELSCWSNMLNLQTCEICTLSK